MLARPRLRAIQPQPVVGVDVDGGLRLAVRSPDGTGSRWRLAAVLPAPVPPGAQRLPTAVRSFARGLREAVMAHRLHGSVVHLSVPPRRIAMRPFTLPPLRDERAWRHAVETEIDRNLVLAGEPRQWDAYRLGETRAGEGDEVWMVVVAPLSVVQPWPELMRWAGLRPVSAEPGILAIARRLAAQPDVPGRFGVLILGLSGIEGAVVRDGRVTARRYLDWHTEDAARSVPHPVGDLEALDQMRAYVRRQEPGITTVFVVNLAGVAFTPGEGEAWLRADADADLSVYPTAVDTTAHAPRLASDAAWLVAQALTETGDRTWV